MGFMKLWAIEPANEEILLCAGSPMTPQFEHGGGAVKPPWERRYDR